MATGKTRWRVNVLLPLLLWFVTISHALAGAVIYTYDAAGRIIKADYGGNTVTYTYDAAGNLLRRQVTAATAGNADCFFNWAERNYSNLFAPPGATSNTVAPYYFRYYPQTSAYLATSSADNHVYYFGPLSNNSILDAGELSRWLSTAGCQ